MKRPTPVLLSTLLCLGVSPSVVPRVLTEPQARPFGIAYVAVADEAGRPVSGLGVTDVRVRVDGHDQRVLDVRPAADPPAVVIIADGYRDDAAIQVRRALVRVLGHLREAVPDARVGLMLAEGAAGSELWHVSTDAARLNAQIGAFVQSGESAPLLESIVVAARTLGAAETPRRMILVLTSQRETTVRASVSPEQTADAVRRANASLWALQTSRPTRAWQATLDNAEVLRTVTRASGGRRDERFTWLIEPNAVALARLMLSQYAVTYTLPSIVQPGLLRVGIARDDVEVYAPGWVVVRAARAAETAAPATSATSVIPITFPPGSVCRTSSS